MPLSDKHEFPRSEVAAHNMQDSLEIAFHPPHVEAGE